MNIAFISAVLPVVLLLWFIYRQDKYQPEPVGKLVWTFFVGCLSVLPAIAMEWGLAYVGPDESASPVLGGLYDGFVVAGFSEELCKLLLLLMVIWRSPHFDEYFDGVVYAVYLSLGFACVENISYVMGGDAPMATAIMRGILAVPAHFLFAVAMGYYVSLAKFDPAHRVRHFFCALFYPVLLHGTYDALLMVSGNISGGDSLVGGMVSLVLLVAFVVFDIRLWKKGIKRIKRMQERTQEEGYSRENPFKGFRWDV